MKKLCSIILCASIIFAEIGMMSYTSNAQENIQSVEENNIDETDEADEMDDISDSTLDDSGDAADTEAAEDEPLDESSSDSEDTLTTGSESDSINSVDSVDSENIENEEDHEPEELLENSWRYSNGELDVAEAAARSGYANAWNKENGRYVNSRGEVIPGALKKGIDVSRHQGRINWAQVKASGIEFAIIRCGYGNDLVSQDDKWWEYNVSECERLGIPYGVYIYSYATTIAEAESEANHVLRLLKGHAPSYPVYYDMEDDSTIFVGNRMLGNMAKTFCDKISAAGYRPGIYANKNWWNTYLTSSVFNNSSWSKWVAQYNYECNYQGSYDMWQCTSSGYVNGVDGKVDLNFWMTKTQDADPIQVDNLDIVKYTKISQTFGWQNEVNNGCQSGVTGYSKRLEALKINVGSGYGDLGVEYSSHVKGIGWQEAVNTGALSGTEGQARSIEAVKIKLTGTEAEKYDIYYRVHSQSYGWLGWAMNGKPAGTEGFGKRMEALQIVVVKKGEAAPGTTEEAFKIKQKNISYSTHVQKIGWQPFVNGGQISGTEGQAKRLEGIKISLDNQKEIRYKVHVQTYGWQDWVTGGNVAGTTGQSKRLEAICIELSGNMKESYDIYYRVHSQTYGWLGWAKNGEEAGTEGLAKRLEAIQIVLVEKGGNPPGSTEGAFIKK